MYALCPRCGELYGSSVATCRYCGYLGIIPLSPVEDEKYMSLIRDNEYVIGLKLSRSYLDELREKYKNGEVYDENLWNNRVKKDEVEIQRRIKESNEIDEEIRRDEEESKKLSWKDRNKAIGVTCPTCGSSDRVYRISAAKKGFLAGLMGAASAGLQAKTFQCKNCGYKW